MTKQNRRQVISKMQEVLSKREEALEKLIDIENLQAEKYMVLWKYEDKIPAIYKNRETEY